MFSPGFFVSVAGWSVTAHVRHRRTRAPKAPIPRGVWGHAPPGKFLKCRTPQGGF